MNERKETEVRLADLFAMLLKAIKPILCVILIVGILGGAYGLYAATHRKVKVTKDEVNEAQTAASVAKSALTAAEQALKKRNDVAIPDAKRKIRINEQLVERRQEYMDNSLFQKLDPFNCGVSRLTFFVKTDFTAEPDVAGLVEDPRTSIAMAYANISAMDTEILDKVRSIMQTTAEKRYVEELISVMNLEDRFVQISVYNSDPAVAEKVAKYIYGTIEKRLQESVASYTASIISTYTGFEVNWEIYNLQMTNEDNLVAAQRALDSAQELLETMETGVAEKEQAVETAKDTYEAAVKTAESLKTQYENAKPGTAKILRNGVKFALIGLVAGLVLACAFVLLANLLNGRLHNQTEIRNRYAFPLLGVLPREKKLWFEKTVRKLEGESLGGHDEEAQATAQSMLARIGGRSVCLISSLGKEPAEKLAAYTDGKTPVCGNILSDADAVKTLTAFDGVVLVEKKGKTRIDQIDSEVQRVKALDKEVVGIVLL